MRELDASVIIPTYNRKGSLEKTLSALDHQTWPPDRFEVIVVDDGSTDGTHEVAEACHPYPFVYIRQDNRGSAAARNRGAQESQGQLLIFIDDDIIPKAEYIEGLVQEHLMYRRVVGMGTLFTDSSGSTSPFGRIYSDVFDPKDSPDQGAFVSFADCTTNNLSVDREAFFELGMMQDIGGDGPTWWGDVDFGYRALKAGYKFRRSGKAVCYHVDYSIQNLKLFCRRLEKAGKLAVLLTKKYPDLRTELPMLVDKAPISLGQDPWPLVLHKLFHALTAWKPVLWSMEQLVEILERTAPSPSLLRPFYRWITSSYILQGYRAGLREYGLAG